MEAINDALKLIARALEMLDSCNVYADPDKTEHEVNQTMKLLQEAVDKLSTCST